MPLVAVQCIAEAMHTPVIIVLSILTEVFGLEFHHWQWASDLLSDDQKADSARQTVMLLTTLTGSGEAKMVRLLDW
jgi:hypothetical protein